jgi:hypothetical protein
MLPPTVTELEVVRLTIASVGAVAALVVVYFTVTDYLRLRQDNVNGPTTIVYAEKIPVKIVLFLTQVIYTTIGVAALLAPPPIPPHLAALISESAADAVVSVATYLDIAVQGSIIVTSMIIVTSFWQLYSRKRLLAALRAQAHKGGAQEQEVSE